MGERDGGHHVISIKGCLSAHDILTLFSMYNVIKKSQIEKSICYECEMSRHAVMLNETQLRHGPACLRDEFFTPIKITL